MKKIVFFACTLLLLMACQPDTPTTVFNFDVTVSRIESHKVWLDIFPKDEFLRYNLDWMPVEDWNKFYQSDQDYKNELASILPLYTEEEYKLVTEEGAFLSTLFVEPNTAYYIVITSLDSNRRPVDVRKVPFQSAEEYISSFTLSADEISMQGGVITINPTDTANTYFWDYELKKNVDRDWVASHSVWFYYDVEYYYQMDFFPDMFSKGYDSENCYDFYPDAEIEVGDTICLLAVGYDKSGETSPAYMPFWIIWGGKESASTVVEADKDGYEAVFRGDFGESTSPKRNTAKAAKWSPKQHPMSSFGHTGKYIPRHIRSAKR